MALISGLLRQVDCEPRRPRCGEIADLLDLDRNVAFELDKVGRSNGQVRLVRAISEISLTDNDRLRREGKVDQASASVKDKAEDAVDAVKDKVDRALHRD